MKYPVRLVAAFTVTAILASVMEAQSMVWSMEGTISSLSAPTWGETVNVGDPFKVDVVFNRAAKPTFLPPFTNTACYSLQSFGSVKAITLTVGANVLTWTRSDLVVRNDQLLTPPTVVDAYAYSSDYRSQGPFYDAAVEGRLQPPCESGRINSFDPPDGTIPVGAFAERVLTLSINSEEGNFATRTAAIGTVDRYSVTAIPEPGANAILAGIAALALVATIRLRGRPRRPLA